MAAAARVAHGLAAPARGPAIPLELIPIYAGDRSLDQYQSADGGRFDMRECRVEAQSNHAVYKAMFRGKLVALKEYISTGSQLRHCYQEAMVLRRVQHPGTVEIQALFIAQNGNLYLQFPFYEGNTLSQ